MSNTIKFQNAALKFPKPLPSTLRKKIAGGEAKVGESKPVQSPGDSVSFTAPIARKTPRPGSDMDIMVNDLERTGALPAKTEPPTPRPKPREGSDMADMLANIDRAEKKGFEEARPHVGANGTIALLEDPPLVSPSATKKAPANKAKKTDDGSADDAMSGGGVAIEGVEQAGNSAAETLGAAGEVVEQGAQVASQTAQSLSAVALETAVQCASSISGLLAGPLLYRGAKKLKEGVKEGDLDKKLEGANSMMVGVRSGATAVTLANLASGATSALGEVASVAAPVLGGVTGVVDGFLGLRDIAKGKKLDGFLRIGFGASVAAAAASVGPIATVATGGFLLARVGRKVHEVRQSRKAANANSNAG